jgi:peptidoglycan/LPS O-acetylase OafA/YrhL
MAAADHTKRRDSSVDTARGIFCIMLVLYHVVVFHVPEGLDVDSASLWHKIAAAFVYVRMPLFAFISGYVYGARPVANGEARFILGKVRRLLLPMFVANTLFSLILVHGVHRQAWGLDDLLITVSPYWNYWFLEALFIIFIATLVLEKLRLLTNGFGFLFVTAAAIAAERWIIVPGMYNFNLTGAIYLFPYFLCGLACVRFHIEGKYVSIVTLAVSIGLALFVIAGSLGYAHLPGRISMTSLLLGVSCAYLLVVQLKWRNDFLMFIGRSSYAVFLYHIFFTSLTWLLASSLHVHEINTLVIMITTGGVAGPLLADRIIKRFALTRTLFLGERWTASRPRKEAASALAVFVRKFPHPPDLAISDGGEATIERVMATAEKEIASEH